MKSIHIILFSATLACTSGCMFNKPEKPVVKNPIIVPLTEQEKAIVKQEVFTKLDEWMKGFNALDIPTWQGTMHFPTYRLANGKMYTHKKPPKATPEGIQNYLGEEWGHSAWIERDIVQYGRHKVHVATTFARFRKDNTEIARYQSLYILRKIDGKWGVTFRSSFAR